ncbi:hypothetical protein [Thermoanaerobacter ethanolicus]
MLPILIAIAILGGIIISNKALNPISHMTEVATEISEKMSLDNSKLIP